MATLVLLVVTDERTAVPGFFDLPVTGGTATFEMLGLQPEERGHAIALLSREMFTQSASAIERAVAVRNFVAAAGAARQGAGDRRATRRRSPLRRRSPPITGAMSCRLPIAADLFAALIANRSALLVCAGAMTADPSLRALLERDRGLLRWIVTHRAGGILDGGAQPEGRQRSHHRSRRRRGRADLGSARRGKGDAAGEISCARC